MYGSNSLSDQKSTAFRLSEKILELSERTGLIRFGRHLFSRSLTVLNYHRVNDPNKENFDSFRPNVSASPIAFKQQMEYLSKWFNVVSISDVVEWLHAKKSLPNYAALITFDDGYLDNYTYAYPILREYNFPAIIFLASGHIGTNTPFFWDLATYCFFYTTQDCVIFPDGSERSWKNEQEKKSISIAWVESMKTLSNEEKQKWVDELPIKLNISIPHNYFKNLMVNWDQVREMSSNGIDFGGHTITHPILSRISHEQARLEIEGSKSRIELETGKPVLGFAYPNGMKQDINAEIEALVIKAGYQAAFTLLNGPTSLREVKKNPFAIRRIFILHTHTIAHYSALTSPINRYRK